MQDDFIYLFLELIKIKENEKNEEFNEEEINEIADTLLEKFKCKRK